MMGAKYTQVLTVSEIGATGGREACRKIQLRLSVFKARVLFLWNIVTP
jgi:hypothetical protein